MPPLPQSNQQVHVVELENQLKQLQADNLALREVCEAQRESLQLLSQIIQSGAVVSIDVADNNVEEMAAANECEEPSTTDSLSSSSSTSSLSYSPSSPVPCNGRKAGLQQERVESRLQSDQDLMLSEREAMKATLHHLRHMIEGMEEDYTKIRKENVELRGMVEELSHQIMAHECKIEALEAFIMAQQAAEDDRTWVERQCQRGLPIATASPKDGVDHHNLDDHSYSDRMNIAIADDDIVTPSVSEEPITPPLKLRRPLNIVSFVRNGRNKAKVVAMACPRSGICTAETPVLVEEDAVDQPALSPLAAIVQFV